MGIAPRFQPEENLVILVAVALLSVLLRSSGRGFESSSRLNTANRHEHQPITPKCRFNQSSFVGLHHVDNVRAFLADH